MARPKKYGSALAKFASTALKDSDYARLEKAAKKIKKTKSELLRDLVLDFCEKIEKK